MKRFGLVFGLVSIAVILVITPVLLTQAKTVRDAAQASKCHGNFTAISTAMQKYYERYGHFPPAYVAGKDGKPAHSWRVLLLETFDTQTFEAYRFDEPWDGPNNRKLEEKMPSCYKCPVASEGEKKWRASYFAVVGPNTVFQGPRTVKLADIKRPHSDTVLVVEAVQQGIHWMEPKDLDFEVMSFELNDPKKPSVSSHHRRGPGAYTVDGSMLWLSGVGTDRLREMLLITK